MKRATERIAAAALLLTLLAGCDGVDGRQLALCRTLIPAFEPDGAVVTVTAAHPGDGHALMLRYRTDRDHWIRCRFAGGFFEAGRTGLTGVATDRTGELSPMRFFMLKLWAGLPRSAPAAAEASPRGAPPPWLPLLYLLQQIVNGVTVACVYGLLALGYTLVYGIVGRINLAMGELTMIGAMIAAMAATGLSFAGAGLLPLALLAVLAAAMGFTAAQGWAAERLVFGSLRRSLQRSLPRGGGSHAPLIAAVGLAIALQEGVRLLHGAGEWWPTPVYATTNRLIGVPGFAVTALTSQAVVVATTLGLYALLAWVMRRTAYGRAYRACADDAGTAALLGLDVDRTVACTFALGAAYAAAAGVVIALQYGGVNFFTGWQVGFKALTAAVVGGVGSVPGAMLGGALLALVETGWAAYFDLAYKDVVAFGLLAVFLLYRPHGLLGQARSRGD